MPASTSETRGSSALPAETRSEVWFWVHENKIEARRFVWTETGSTGWRWETKSHQQPGAFVQSCFYSSFESAAANGWRRTKHEAWLVAHRAATESLRVATAHYNAVDRLACKRCKGEGAAEALSGPERIEEVDACPECNTVHQ